MQRVLQAASVAAVVAIAGCHHSQPKTRSLATSHSSAAMDSAEIERLCLHPDSVRAERADCVLKDQGVMGERRVEAPPTPPRR
jgi:hypothetical protein